MGVIMDLGPPMLGGPLCHDPTTKVNELTLGDLTNFGRMTDYL